MGMKVVEIEVSEKLEAIRGLETYDGVYILVRYHRQPVGWITLKDISERVIRPDQLCEAITIQLGWPLMRVAFSEQLDPTSCEVTPSSPISVVVCTRDRTDRLVECLQALLALEYRDYEVVVVDNASSNDDTALLVCQLPIRYVREERPGLDWARNRGIAESRYGIIAFTDDDARPDRHWLNAIARAFAERDVMVVTGPVVPAELETDAQILFELGYGGMKHGFRRRAIRRQAITERDLLWSNAFGVGGNMAFRRELFTSVGLFDVALDAGTPAGGGGDIEMFHRVVAQGHILIYEPAALVWHVHRRDLASLRQQLFDNGRSFGSYLLTCACSRSVRWRSMLSFVAWEWLYGWILRRLWRPGLFPRHLIMSEVLGMLSSPMAYGLSHVRKRHTSAAFQTVQRNTGFPINS